MSTTDECECLTCLWCDAPIVEDPTPNVGRVRLRHPRPICSEWTALCTMTRAEHDAWEDDYEAHETAPSAWIKAHRS